MADNQEKETPIAVHNRTLEEIEWYLKSMQGFPNRQIAAAAASAFEDWQRGNRKSAQTVLIRWYNTVKQGTNHTLNEGCAEALNMEEVLMSNDVKLHMDLLVQMIVTLQRQ
ncbi:MAG: hypothetical protein WEA04_03525 [Candidatus Andersenbacteria bacterium]